MDRQRIVAGGFVGQMEQALRNIAAVGASAGGGAERITPLTWDVTDKREYLARAREIGRVYRELIGSYTVAMTAVKAVALLEAARMLSAQPEAMQLRYLQTMTQVAGDRASTIVFPLPMDLIGPLLGKLRGGDDPSKTGA